MNDSNNRIDHYLMSLLASRIANISIQMSNALIKSARSSVLALARDCSTAICEGNGDVLAFPVGYPVHVGCSSLAARSLLEIQGDDLRPGDAYLHNSPYHGNTHPADHIILSPVFYEDELMFITYVLGHQADVGNSIPTTYHPWARDVYQEGAIIFPCVRVQRDYKDIDDIIRMCKMRIRVPDVWYGDYLAMIGATRIGEQELIKLIKKHGKETIRAFCTQWQEYGKQRMKEEIKKLPAGTASYETRHDPIPELVPNGVDVRVRVIVEPDEGRVTCDFTENDDSMPCGLNVSEATLTSAARSGVLRRLCVSMSDFPVCEGSLSRIRVMMREGSVVGKAKHPFSSSVATTNVNDRAEVAVTCAFNQITDRMGMAEPHYDLGVNCAVISGTDSRFGGRHFETEILSGFSGGPGINGHDGFLHYGVSEGGLTIWNSIEMIERSYPILYIQQEIIKDGIGSGKWDAAPDIKLIIRAMADPVTFVYLADGHDNPAKGAKGGYDGVPAQVFLASVKKGLETEISEELPTIHHIVLQPGEAIIGIDSSGGGYGDPLERDPERVRHRAREGWISLEKAGDVYGVVLDTGPELFAVDWKATEELRKVLKDRRSEG